MLADTRGMSIATTGNTMSRALTVALLIAPAVIVGIIALFTSPVFAAKAPEQTMAAAMDAVDAKGRHPVIQPDRRDKEIETLQAEIRRLQVRVDMCQSGFDRKAERDR